MSVKGNLEKNNEGDEIFFYSIENVRKQLEFAPCTLGFYELRFYTDGKRPSRERTGSIDVFYYYPSGGTIRDKNMNIIFYEPKLDIYRNIALENGEE